MAPPVPKMGTTPPVATTGADAGSVAEATEFLASRLFCAASCLTMASLTSCSSGTLELPNCRAALTLAIASGANRTPLLMTDADALVAMAIAEPPTAA